MSKRVALYLRVSTGDQTVENQRRELLTVAEQQSWSVVAEFCAEGVSGAKGRDKRPGFDCLCKAMTRRDIDLVMAWSIDRLSRSLPDLVAFLGELRAKCVDLFLLRQNLDTSTPSGRAMFGMLGVFSEFERAMIRERVMAGMARARSQGKALGRPQGAHRSRNRPCGFPARWHGDYPRGEVAWRWRRHRAAHQDGEREI